MRAQHDLSPPLSLTVFPAPACDHAGAGASVSATADNAKPAVRASLDIANLLAGWEFEPGQVNVRTIQGDDGRPKLQIRLDLGVLQLELAGRPDGRRPHDFPSLLDYHVDRLNEHRTRYGTELGFVLSPRDCRELRDEAAMYYHRYLGLFVLGDYSGTARDTARNLAVLNLCRRHAAEEPDQAAMEVYRPYLLMMHARAQAGLCLQADDFRGALRSIRTALREIRGHFRRFGGRRAFGACEEVRVLRKLSHYMEAEVAQSPIRRLRRELSRAVRKEDYERAAEIRDELERLEK